MKNLKSVRLAQGKTIEQCATAVGVGRQTWMRYEACTSDPSLERLDLIASFLKTSVDELMGRTERQGA